MATISSTGVGSGLDVNSIVTQLVALERKPIDALKSQRNDLDTQLSAFGQIQSYVDTLRTTARTLAAGSTWTAVTATSADSSAVAAKAGSGTAAGSYAVQVNWLATAQLAATTALPSPTTAVGQGTLHIELGTWAADLSGFSPNGTAAVDITIGPGEDALEKIRDKINATSGAGVRASIVNDAGGSRLVLQSATTGAANGFRIEVTDDDGIDDNDAGLSRLAYDPANGAGVMSRPQAARNASATINGLAVESAGNTMTDVIDGVTLNLLKPTTGTVDIAISADNGSMRKSVDAFVSAYNDLAKMLRDQTRYDAGTKVAGPLQGDRVAVTLQQQLRSMLGLSSSASATFGRLSDIGLDVQADGSIKTNGSKLDAAIANGTEIARFFTIDGATDASSGLAVRMRRRADALSATDGSIANRRDGLRKRMTVNDDRQAALEDRVAATERRLRAQYQALDASMARLTGLQGYISQQITNWNKG